MWDASFVMLLFVSEYRRFLLMYLLISLNITGLEDGEGEMKIIPALDSLIVKSNVLVVVLILLTAGMMTFTFEVTPTFADSYTLIVASDETIEWSADGSGWQPTVACWVHPSWPEIEGATWIWRTEYTDPVWEYNNVPDGGWFFRKVFTIPEDAYKIAGSIEITVDNSYNLSINGVFIGGDGTMSKDGPDSLEWKTIESFDISGALTPGENTILIRALNYYSWGSSTTNPAGIIFKAVVTYCKPTVTNLIAGQHINVGTVTAWDDGAYLYVRYSTTDGWVLTETHLAVAASLDEIPQTKKGNPKVGKFSYRMMHDPAVSKYTYVIDLGEWEASTELYIAAHAVVYEVIGDGCESPQWATHVLDYNQGTLVNGTPIADPERTDPNTALGSPDGSFYSLGFVSDDDGYIVLSFDYPIYNGPGDDIVIYEVTYGREVYPDEVADVYVIINDKECYAGTVTNHDADGVGTVSIPDDLSYVDAVKLVDNTNPDDFDEVPKPSDGYDLDAVGACYLYFLYHEETAWGDGYDFPGNNWAMYFTYTVCDP